DFLEALPAILLTSIHFTARATRCILPHSPRLAGGVTLGGRPAAAQRLDQEHGGHHPATAEVPRGPLVVQGRGLRHAHVEVADRAGPVLVGGDRDDLARVAHRRVLDASLLL